MIHLHLDNAGNRSLCQAPTIPSHTQGKKVKQSHYRPGQAQRVLRKFRFSDFVTTAQDGGRLSALRTGRLYPEEIFLVLVSVRG